MKKNKGLMIILIGVLLVAMVFVFSAVKTQRAQAAFLEKYNLAGMDVKTIVKEFDSTIDEPRGLSSSISGKFLTLQGG